MKTPRPTLSRLLAAAMLFGTAAPAAEFVARELATFDHPGTQTFDAFGETLALEEDILVAGMPDLLGKGRVLLFRRNVGTTAEAWNRFTTLDGAFEEDAEFGASVAIDGGLLVVGAPGDDTDFEDPAPGGLVHVYRRTSDGSFGRELALSGTDIDSQAMGSAVAVCGDIVVAGAPAWEGGRGRAYVYRIGGDTPGSASALLATLEGPAGQTARFGSAVAVEGNTVFVGAPRYDTAASERAGAVFVFKQDFDPSAPGTPAVNAWGLRNTLVPEDADDAEAGGTLAVRDGVLAVGEEFADGSAGRVHLYRRDLGGLTADDWPFLKSLNAPAGTSRFGRALAFDGDLLAVGGNSSVTVHARNAHGADAWGGVEHLEGPPEAAGSFGAAVAFSAGVLAAGAPESFTAEQPGGSVTTFAIEPEAWRHVIDIEPFGIDPGVEVGTSLDLSGDTLVAGAPDDDGGAGAAYVFRRNRTLNNPALRVSEAWGQVAKLTPPPGAPTGFGHAVAISGNRIAVSAPGDDSPGNQGTVHVFERHFEAADPGDSFADSWNLRATIPDPQTNPGGTFGSNLSLHNNRLAVSNADRERIFLFRPSPTAIGIWEQTFTAAQSANDDLETGLPVAIFGEALAALSGATGDLRFHRADLGEDWSSVYPISAGSSPRGLVVSSASHLAWVSNLGLQLRPHLQLTPSFVTLSKPPSFEGEFATAIDLSATSLLIGSTPSNGSCPEVLLHERNAGGADAWGPSARLLPADPTETTGFGAQVALDGRIAAVAHPGKQRLSIYIAGESPYLEWLRGHFDTVTLADPALEAGVWGPDADPDGDTRGNLLEYALLSSPLVADAASPIAASIDPVTEEYQLGGSFRRIRGDVGICFEWSRDLSDWRQLFADDDPAAPDFDWLVQDQGATQSWELSGPATEEPHLYFRIRAEWTARP